MRYIAFCMALALLVAGCASAPKAPEGCRLCGPTAHPITDHLKKWGAADAGHTLRLESR